jgi:hypothetical protein
MAEGISLFSRRSRPDGQDPYDPRCSNVMPPVGMAPGLDSSLLARADGVWLYHV